MNRTTRTDSINKVLNRAIVFSQILGWYDDNQDRRIALHYIIVCYLWSFVYLDISIEVNLLKFMTILEFRWENLWDIYRWINVCRSIYSNRCLYFILKRIRYWWKCSNAITSEYYRWKKKMPREKLKMLFFNFHAYWLYSKRFYFSEHLWNRLFVCGQNFPK